MIDISKFKEAKQVGTLYHYTTFGNLRQILKDNMLKTNRGWTSFTRNKYFNSTTRDISGLNARIAINGDKLSNSYKIEPYFDIEHLGHLGPTEKEQEERVNRPIFNVRKYIVKISLYPTIFVKKHGVYPFDTFEEYVLEIQDLAQRLKVEVI